ncbi:UNVERIFIED_CONTAM: protein NPG1 [Sesamum radiatum]|uniref:Protein NPG1 n=1 Tax=Sesamum radiatum TaxID=300843 RepID=A0AAW2L259_SESRA
MAEGESADLAQLENDPSVRQLVANGARMRTNVVEAKLDEGNIQEAESALREGLSLNSEEARALLGKLEYQRGNVEGALRVFDGIDLQEAIQRIQPSLGDKQAPKKGRSRTESITAMPQNASSVVLEAVYLKAKSLQKLGKLTEAAEECKRVLDAVEKIFSDGIPEVWVENKLQETVSRAVELLPELWKLAGCYSEAVSAYRRALLSQWNVDNECCARIQKAFAVFLLYSGIDVGPPNSAVQTEGSYVPKSNLEESILLLMIIMRKCYLGVGLRMLGLCLGKQAKTSSSDFERSRLQSEALKSLDSALALEPKNSNLIFELGLQYAEHRNLDAALRYAKQYLDATGGSMIRGWRLLALVLSAQQRFSEAEVVTDAALDETSKWDQGPLLRMKAKLKVSQSQHKDAIETYRYLLALVQAQKKSSAPLATVPQMEDDNVNEYEVWHGLAKLYSSLSHWKDAEVCLGKARKLKEYSAETLHTEGVIHEKQGHTSEALASYINGLLLEPRYVPCKILLGAVLSKMGSKMLPVARTLLSDALRIEPTNSMAWYHLGTVHKEDGRLADAVDCFQAAYMLQESEPIESFSTIR